MKNNTRTGMCHAEAGRLGAHAAQAYTAQKHADALEEYLNDPRLCKHCGNPLPYEKRFNTFCGHSCSASHGNAGQVRSIINTRRQINTPVVPNLPGSDIPQIYIPTAHIPRPINYCKFCGKQLSRTAKEYCGNECHHGYLWNLKKQNISETGKFPYDPRLNDTLRRIVKRYLQETIGHKCSVCGLTEWNGSPTPLVTDHIDGDSTNHSVSNLRLVCPNCDAQSTTYKARNQNCTRTEWRKQYYR